MVTRPLVSLLAVFSLADGATGEAEAPIFGSGASTAPTSGGLTATPDEAVGNRGDREGGDARTAWKTGATDRSQTATQTRYFYFDQDYGSESQFGPLNVFVHVGFSVVGKASGFQIYSPFDVDYGSSLRGLAGDYVHVREIPEGYGSYGRWAFLEFAPVVGIPSYPNYILHFLGEGMLSRKLMEYNLSQGMSPGWARALSITTLVAAQQVNEVIESKSVPVGDGIADTLVYNTLGILLFSSDRFASRFANDKVRLYYWPGQALIDVRDGALYNNSETYLLRTTLGKKTRARLNLVLGIPSQGFGISYPLREDDAVGLLVITQPPLVPEHPYAPRPQRERFSYVSAEPQPAGSVVTADRSQIATRLTWDRGGSLLATLEVGFPVRANVIANVYPGFVRAGPVQFGTYLYGDRNLGAMGITLSTISVAPGLRF